MTAPINYQLSPITSLRYMYECVADLIMCCIFHGCVTPSAIRAWLHADGMPFKYNFRMIKIK